MLDLKATLRAMREESGLTQQDLADVLGVAVLSVKRWESDAAQQIPPDEAMQVVLDVLEARKSLVSSALSMASEVDGPLFLSYYRSQEHYDEYGREPGPYTVANANARAVARALEDDGMEVEFVYPGDGYTRL